MEERIIDLVIRVCVEGAYCCRLADVSGDDSAMTVQITMRCTRHVGYSFEMDCGNRNDTIQQDSVLMRQICKGIVDGQLKARRQLDLYDRERTKLFCGR